MQNFENVPSARFEISPDLPLDRWGSGDKETQDALQCIPPDLPYAEWINVGFALISEFGREQGGEMFDNWSQGGSKYERAKVSTVIRWLIQTAR